MSASTVRLTNEEFLPTRWVVGRSKPSRQAIADHCRKLSKKYGFRMAHLFRNEAMRMGIWPVSWRKPDGTRYKSQDETPT